MKYVIDRIEGDIVTAFELDTDKVIKIDKSLIGFDLSDGMIINYENGIYSFDQEETDKRTKKIKNRFDSLKE